MRDMRIKDVMTHMVVTLRPDESVHDAARRLARNHISGAPVVKHGKVVGIVSEYDIVRAIAKPAPVERKKSWLDLLSIELTAPGSRHDGMKVADIMTPRAMVIHEDATIWEAATLIERHGIKRLPVVDSEGYLLGVVSRADLVRVMGRGDNTIRREVVEGLDVLGDDTVGGVIVTCHQGSVTLMGRVDRKTTRDIAVRIAAHVPGVVRVVDRLEHEWDDTKLKLPVPTPNPRHWAARL